MSSNKDLTDDSIIEEKSVSIEPSHRTTAPKEFVGESVKVAVRCRPFLSMELQRHDKTIIKITDDRTIVLDAG